MSKILKLADCEADTVLASAARLPMSGMLSSLAATPTLLLRKFMQARRHRQAMQELLQLDDRMLRDIGVNRSEIPRAALTGRELM